MGPDVVLTTYFIGKPDPQSRSKRNSDLLRKFKRWLRSRRGGAPAELVGAPGPDEFERMRVWYESLIRVGGAGVIFHDCLSPGFVKRWTTPRIRFEPYALKTPRSVNDERYQCYLQWIEAHPEAERIFLLDLFDVEFHRNPFALMDDAKYDLYCGGDPDKFNDEKNRDKMILAYGEPHYEREIKLHAGTCGGRRDAILRLLRRMVETFAALTERGRLENLNMAIYNKCVYDLFDKTRILHGYPLNSRFKKYERSGNFAIRHK